MVSVQTDRNRAEALDQGCQVRYDAFVTKIDRPEITDRGRAAGPLVQTVPYPLRARKLDVVRVEELSPSMRRIVLGGDDLEPEFPFLRLAAADHVKLAFPDPLTGAVDLPQLHRGDRGPELHAKNPVLREYTIRSLDHSAAELSIDFVVHEHGPAGRWAASATPGAAIGVLGPRGSRIYPDSFADYLLVVDETGLPAAERFMEELPPSTPVTVVVIAPEGSIRELPGARSLEVHWLTNVSDRPGAAESVVDFVSDLTIGPETFVWGAGEASTIAALRAHLRAARGVDRESVVLRGYWRRGLVGPPPADEDQ